MATPNRLPAVRLMPINAPHWWACRQHLDALHAITKAILDDRRRETLTAAAARIDSELDFTIDTHRRFLLVDIDELIELAWGQVRAETIQRLGKGKP